MMSYLPWRKVHSAILSDFRFLSLSHLARSLYLHLLLSVDSSGVVSLDFGAVARLLGVSKPSAKRAVAELLQSPFVESTESATRIRSTSELYEAPQADQSPETKRPLTATERKRLSRARSQNESHEVTQPSVTSHAQGHKKVTPERDQNVTTNSTSLDKEIDQDLNKDKENKEIEEKPAQGALAIPAQTLSKNDQKASAVEPKTATEVDQKPSTKPKKPSLKAAEVWEYWRATLGHPRAVLDHRRLKLIEKAIESHGLEVCKKAIEGCKRSSWHMGQNAEKRVYDGIELILRDAEHIERFVAITEGPQRGPQQLSHNYGAHAGLLEGLGETNIESH